VVVTCLLAPVLLALGLLAAPTVASGDTGDVGVEGLSHTGTGTPTGTKRAESVLWYNDGYWWGNLWDTATSDFHIFRFDPAQGWVDTKVTTEPRANTHHDVLWDGRTLYVASHLFVNDGVPAQAGGPATLYRYSYNTATDTYTLVGSSKINDQKTETLVIDKDSTGRLWATWQQNNKVYLNVTGTDGATWGEPFPHPAGDVTLDDTSALIAFGPGKMGLMWDREAGDATDGFYWSVHNDSDPVTTWSTPKAVVSGLKSGDDHMNLKWLDSSGGRVFAAVKTSFTSSTQPLTQLLAMDSTGTWTVHTIATQSECPNRVSVLIDEGAQRLRVFGTWPKPSGTTNAGVCSTSGGAIYEKSTPLSNISFTAAKTVRIVDADQYVHNASSTKQNPNNNRADGTSTANSGLLVIADVGATSRYWHYYEAGTGTSTPPPTSTSTPPPTSTSTPPPPTGGIVQGEVSTTVNTTATSGVTIAKPAGTAAGDVLVACLALTGGTVSGTGVPSGWSPIASVTSIANPHVFGYYKVATASEPANYQWTLGSAVTNGAGIRRYTGASGPDGPASTAAGAATTLAPTVPGVTTTTPGAMLVGCMGINSSSATNTIDSPGGMTQAWDIGGRRHELADGRQATAGPSGGKAWTLSAAREWAGWLVALRPAG